MNTRDESAASNVFEQSEPDLQATEQPTDYASELLRLAADDGIPVGDVPPKETEPESPESEEQATETEAEPTTETDTEPEKTEEEEPAEKEEKPAEAKTEKLVPLSEVLEERAKKKRERERAEKAEALAEQLQAQLAKTVAPVPTEDNPFADINDPNELQRLEASYEKTIDLADENPDGAVDVLVRIDKDGKEIRRDYTPEELAVLRKRADKAIRKFIPERRTYLQQRAVADAQALEIYPELKDPNSEFTKIAAGLAHRLLTGQSSKDPTLLVWVGHAARGYLESLKRNGNSDHKVKSPEAKKIVESAKTKAAPPPVRSRQFVERGSSSAQLKEVTKKLEERGDAESAEEYVGALFSKRGTPNRVESLAE